MDSQRLGHVSFERLAGAGAARVRHQPSAPVKAELTQEDIVDEPEWPALTYDEVVDARLAAGLLTSTWSLHARWPAELAQRWPLRLGRGRRRDMSASDVAALQDEVLTKTAAKPQNPAKIKGMRPSMKRARADEPSDQDNTESGSDSELPAAAAPNPPSSKTRSGSPVQSPVPTAAAATDTVSSPSTGGAIHGRLLRRSSRLRTQTGSPMLVDWRGSPGTAPLMVTKPAVAHLPAAQSQSVSASREQGTVLRRSKRLRGEDSSSVLVDEVSSQAGEAAPLTKPAATTSAFAESQSVGTCQEQASLVRRSTRAQTVSHGVAGGSPRAAAASGPSADTSLYTWPKRRLPKGSAEQDAAVEGTEAADAGKAAGVKNVSEDLGARVTAILATSDLDQITMRQVMEHLQRDRSLEVSAKAVKKEVDRYLLQLHGTNAVTVEEGAASQDSEDTLWKVSIEDELNTDFRDLRPSAASHEEDGAALPNHRQLEPDTANASPDLQAVALALYWALTSLAEAHRRAAGSAAPAASAGMADDDLTHGQSMSHPDSGPPPAAAELSAGVAGVPADRMSSQPMTQHSLDAPHVQKSGGGSRKDGGEGSTVLVSEPDHEGHAAGQAVPDAAVHGATEDPSPSDAEDEYLDSSLSRAANDTFSLAYSILEHLLARRWTEELRPRLGPTSRLTFSLPQLAKFGAARPPRPSAAPAGARSGPAAGDPSPTRGGDPCSFTEGKPSHQAGDGIKYCPAPSGESAGHPVDSSQAGFVQHHSSGVGQRDGTGGADMLHTGSERAQQGNAAEAPYSGIGGDARLVFQAAAIVGVDAYVISCAAQQYQRLVHGNAEPI